MAPKGFMRAVLILLLGSALVKGQDSVTAVTTDASPTTREPGTNVPVQFEDDLNEDEVTLTTPSPYITTTTVKTDPCDPSPCQHGGRCFSDKDDYFCKCPGGRSGVNCEDSEPCFGDPCQNDGRCEEDGDSFICHCPTGWKGPLCDIEAPDPCKSSPCARGICTPDSADPETFICSCPSGWKGITCDTDINECANSPCGSRPNRCINRPGGFQCLCATGYQAKGLTCVDINECGRRHPCDQVCENTPGSFQCKCERGYTLDRDKKSCDDIDECEDGWWDVGPCEYDCTNKPGSYQCSCKEGYKLDRDGHKCVDINECGAGNGGCDQYCQNTRGGRKCYCRRGFNLGSDGRTCIAITCPKTDIHKPAQGKVELSNSNRYESRVWYICNNGYQNTGTPELVCGDSGQWEARGGGSVVPPRCVDVNECDLANGGCEHTCTNSEGSSECSCLPGYQLEDDGYHCTDIDECADDSTNECEHGCVNVESSFYCTCPEGYQIDLMDGKSCQPINCTGLYHPTYGRVTAVDSDTDCTTRDVVRGTKCRYTCEDGYEPVGPADRQVVDGEIARECRITRSWSGKRIECSPRECPQLTLPDNGQVYPPDCLGQARFGKRCTVSCATNYRLRGEAVTTCTNVGSPGDVVIDWSTKTWTCVEAFPEPYVICPDDVNMELGEGESHVTVNITSPQSNYRTTIDGDYHLGENNFTIGQTKVVFRAHGHGGETATCTMRIRVLDVEAPTVEFCPESQVIETAEMNPTVTWEDPQFTDNVGIKSVTHIVEPNRPFTWGIYYVKYTAGDEHRNFAECVFTIHVKKKECKELVPPKNGELSCDSWFLGKFCQLSCNSGFAPFEEAAEMYACNQDGVWRPTAKVPDCVEVSEQVAQGLGKMCRPGAVTKQRRGRTVCVSCPSGTSWSVTTGGPKCVDCPVGTYQTETGQTTCGECPNGTNTTEPGAKREEGCYETCPPGTSSDTGLGPECIPCRQGFYQPLAGQTTCLWCPEKTNTTSAGSLSLDDCVARPRVLSHGLFRSIEVSEGDPVTLDCHAKGRPLPSVTWVKDGSEDILNLQDIEGEGHHKDHKIVKLTIAAMRVEDEGLYKCVATNIAGSHEREVAISIAQEDEE